MPLVLPSRFQIQFKRATSDVINAAIQSRRHTGFCMLRVPYDPETANLLIVFLCFMLLRARTLFFLIVFFSV